MSGPSSVNNGQCLVPVEVLDFKNSEAPPIGRVFMKPGDTKDSFSYGKGYKTYWVNDDGTLTRLKKSKKNNKKIIEELQRNGAATDIDLNKIGFTSPLWRKSWSNLYIEHLKSGCAKVNELVSNDPKPENKGADYYVNLYIKSFQDDLDKALFYITKAIEIKPKASLYYMFRAELYSEMGDFFKAEQDFNTAIELEPRNHQYYRDRASFYLKYGLGDKAIADRTKAIELRPDGFTYMFRGEDYAELGREQEALKDFDEAYVLSQGDAFLMLSLGQEYEELGQNKKAIDCYTKAIETESGYDSEYALFLRASLYEHLRMYDEAIEDLKRRLSFATDIKDKEEIQADIKRIGAIQRAAAKS